MSLTVTGTRGLSMLGMSFFNCKIIAKDFEPHIVCVFEWSVSCQFWTRAFNDLGPHFPWGPSG